MNSWRAQTRRGKSQIEEKKVEVRYFEIDTQRAIYQGQSETERERERETERERERERDQRLINTHTHT